MSRKTKDERSTNRKVKTNSSPSQKHVKEERLKHMKRLKTERLPMKKWRL
jgi:hypothetical protein